MKITEFKELIKECILEIQLTELEKGDQANPVLKMAKKVLPNSKYRSGVSLDIKSYVPNKVITWLNKNGYKYSKLGKGY